MEYVMYHATWKSFLVVSASAKYWYDVNFAEE